ncbi:unnamed protein product [Psylliodes chrysocephalus]|uniref:Adenylate kinase n=1 Tax=Psylliodes chrysocephalus TaxID=3402493 RepID=A0A9P0CPX0_9CUCU|nr:unnamed protein product [Psylliodes chrysocephala]
MLKIEKLLDRTTDLKPLKAIVLGPPASGKTSLAQRLCRHYGAHYVNVKTMIDETLQELSESIERAKETLLQIQLNKEKFHGTEGEVEEEQLGEDTDDDINTVIIEDCQDQINMITDTMENSENKKLPDEMVCRLMKNFLSNPICQTRGFILDGYPKSTEQAIELFGIKSVKIQEVAEESLKPESIIPGEGASRDVMDAPRDSVPTYNILIKPDYVVGLDASDEYLCQRVMKLPQKLVFGTHFDEVGMLRRLAEYHEHNQTDNSVLKFFDDNDINPIVINLIDEETLEELTLDDIYDMICNIFGEPIPGFGLTAEEEAAIRKLELEQLRLLEEEQRLEQQLMEKKAKKEYEEKMEKWNETLEKLQLEEEKVLAAQSEPLRYYLMKYIFPTLSKGLVEVAKVKPEDPVDFLAEYLFKENPEGKMFDPSYTREGEKILQQYEEEVKPIADLAEHIE